MEIIDTADILYNFRSLANNRTAAARQKLGKLLNLAPYRTLILQLTDS
jgi:hypothetical protein